MIKVEDVYPITTRKMPNGDEYVFITDDDLREYTIPARYDSLMRQLSGQTRYLYGTYPYDVERWLNGQENND